MAKVKTRLYITPDINLIDFEKDFLTLGKPQSHFLKNVLRLTPGDHLALFNGKDGEWLAEIEELSKSSTLLRLRAQIAQQSTPLPLRLLFAPIKKDPLNFMIEKATELGITELQPVITTYTNVERVRTDRLRANVIEAAEQCGRDEIPVIYEPVTLEKLLREWTTSNPLFACVETGAAQLFSTAITNYNKDNSSTVQPPTSILIGPEGGFSKAELSNILKHNFISPVSLGPRILRAETAALTALAVFQSLCGDWNTRPQNY